jgi:hypothetical protein
MSKATVFLRTALFTLGGPDGHLPPGVAIIEGDVNKDNSHGGLVITTTRLLDDRGRPLAEVSLRLVLPVGKVDHLLLH